MLARLSPHSALAAMHTGVCLIDTRTDTQIARDPAGPDLDQPVILLCPGLPVIASSSDEREPPA